MIEPYAVDVGIAAFDLAFDLAETPAGIRCRVDYRTDLFEAATIERLLGKFHYLLQQIVAAPEMPIHSYSLITPESRENLPDPTIELHESSYPPVTRRFQEWADRIPRQVAISQGEQLLHLRRRSGIIQRHRGMLELQVWVGPGDVVALHGTRSAGTVVAMLGILSSGGVLLLVDADLPARRKMHMLGEAVPKAVIEVGGANGWRT